MATSPFEVGRFGGLKFTPDPEELGANDAVDLLNVDVWKQGRVATRDGYTSFSTVMNGAPSNRANTILQVDATGNLLASDAVTGKTWAIDNTGASITSLALSAVGMANFGTPTTTLTYLACGASLRSWSGVAFALVNNTYQFYRLAVTPWDNRLVSADGAHQVRFSDAGDGATWGANNFVGLTPGDGERITAIIAWREYVFVFKQTRIFVFYGTSTDSGGNPVFQYKTIDAVGAVDTLTTPGLTYHTAAATRAGVFFLGRDGVYVINGISIPQKVSGPLDAWFRGETLPFSTLPAFTGYTDPALGAIEDRVYVCPMTDTSLTFVLDTNSGEWSAYDWKLTATAPYGTGQGRRVPLLGIGNVLYKHSAAATSDAGSAISWRYSSGLYSPAGNAERVTVTLESLVTGTGTASLQVANNHGAFDTGSSLTLGTSPAVADAWQQIDREGFYFQHKLSGSGQAVVHRVAHFVSFVKPSGVA